MLSLSRRLSFGVRFVGVTVVLTVAYLAVSQAVREIIVAVGPLFEPRNTWNEEAADLADATAAAERHLPADARLLTWRLGVRLGYASQFLGPSATASSEALDRDSARIAEVLHGIDEDARRLQLGNLPLIPVRTLNDFIQLNERIEADEIGLAERVEKRLTTRHRHLFLAAMHVGTELCRVVVSGGTLHLPEAAKIARHATLAGLPAELWRQLVEVPTDLPPSQIVERYRAAIAAVEAHLATSVAGDDSGR